MVIFVLNFKYFKLTNILVGSLIRFSLVQLIRLIIIIKFGKAS